MHYIFLIFNYNVKRFFKTFVIASSLNRSYKQPARGLFSGGPIFLTLYFIRIYYLFRKVLYVLFLLNFRINVTF